jgi:dolichyl-phosphate-mannose-protein mannosyltransferase
MKHFASRALGLIVIPVGIYVGSFHVHFRLLHKSGPGDANMSSLFQAQRQGSDLAASPIDVAYGGVLTFKSRSYGGGLLHSHVQTYPQGSKQQQVTTYHHKDHNNEWIIVPSASDLKNSPLEQEADDGNGGESMRLVREGERVKLRHKSTGKYLHSHVVEAPLTKGDYEVSSYGSNERELEDPNDYWRVELVSDAHPGAKRSRHLRSLSTHFRLKHVQTGCYLRSRNLHLPEWGFKQGEVTCARQPSSPTGREFLWNVESQVNDKLPRGDASQYRSRFLDDVRDCNVGMWLTNNALTPNPELEPGILTSTARDWFWMRKGIRMSGWDDARTKFYMLGTPMVWQASSISIVSLLAILALLLLLSKRHVITLDTPGTRRLLWQARIGLGGWALHYLPFFLIGRVLYLHHYYPALTFAILCSGILFDYATVNMGTRHRWAAFTIMAVAIVANYVYFSPLCYGMNGPAAQYQGRRWLSSWNL